MEHTYQPTDVVLAKVKGYPAWPAMVVPTELIPEHILRTRHQQSTKRKTQEADDAVAADEEEEDVDPDKYIVYSNILKFRKFDSPSQQYCVKFFCDDSYIWVRPADLKPLSVEDCQKWLERPRNKKLIPAYEMASKGSEGIDVWEFIEYGSAGKPDEEEYEEPFEEEQEMIEEDSGVEYESDSADERLKPSRSSARQKKRRETKNARNKRNTRSKRQLEEIEDDIVDSDEEFLQPKTRRDRAKSNTKKRPLIVKYKFEDDEDWTLVGRGPQDLCIQEHVSSFANRLAQKKNMESHLENKLELTDRVNGINKLLLEILTSKGRESSSLRDDCEIVLDEFNIALTMKGALDEFSTVFQSSTELLSYFRLLFNMKGSDLKDWGLWDQFQDYFTTIYRHEFIPDREEWSAEKSLAKKDKTQLDDSTEKEELKEQNGFKQEIKT